MLSNNYQMNNSLFNIKTDIDQSIIDFIGDLNQSQVYVCYPDIYSKTYIINNLIIGRINVYFRHGINTLIIYNDKRFSKNDFIQLLKLKTFW